MFIHHRFVFQCRLYSFLEYHCVINLTSMPVLKLIHDVVKLLLVILRHVALLQDPLMTLYIKD